ncbi:MAG TPA: endonuclease/exonuclease/phosphatase family protein [Pseudonocardiaceae bacterium]
MNSGRRTGWIVGGVLATVLVLFGLVVLLAPRLGLSRTLGIAAVLPARDALTAGGVLALVIAAVACFWRSPRPVALPLGVAMVILVAASTPAFVGRGLTDADPDAPDATRLRVLEWNTNGGLVDPDAIMSLADRQQADVVVLPDALIGKTTSAYRQAIAASGGKMRLFAQSGRSVELAVLIAEPYADEYRITGAGPDANKTLILAPARSDLPTIVALHSVKPTPRGMSLWRSELNWVADQCGSGRVIVTGDFNASIDNFGGPGLGTCRDAAIAMHAGSVGTWPTVLPTWVGMPIDHVLTTPAAGSVLGFTVLASEDRSGARHRPTLTVISEAK